MNDAGQKNDDASERIAALEADNQRLRELLAAAGRLAEVGRFAAKQNHELRQPLFAIKGLAQLLLDRDAVDAQEVRDFARHIVEQSDRLSSLVGELRHLSVPAARIGRPVADISAVLLRVASLLEWRVRRGVTLRTEIAADLPPAAVANHQLEQILINLLSNALDAVAGQAQPTLQVRVTRAKVVGPPAPAPEPRAWSGTSRGGGAPGDGGAISEAPRGASQRAAPADMLQLLVADNGSGVPLSVRGRLFENFFTTKGAEAGTGLGLAVSREIARGVGGELSLLDHPGTWNDPAVTCFCLTLPVATESAI